ncbi:hypothetical protein HH1059_09490 [Halorhodospira halochloris]|uniref:Uncharacterized protein n=1 Tax=Halorhodospira halochloris TaxID=1052 RepID=A0A120MZS6_HALHR|nr:hypothetical protein HH1059_09490 [Halorhodospira halochloris]
MATGPGLVYGDGTHTGSLHTSLANPAGTPASPRVGVQFGANVGFGYELGDMNQIIDSVDEVMDLLDKEFESFSEAKEGVDALDDVLKQLGEHGRGKLRAGGSVPIVVGRADAGWALGIELGSDFSAGFSVLDDPLRVENNEVKTETSLYLKGAQVQRLSLAPGLKVADWDGRNLYVGARVNYYSADMYKTVVPLDGQDGDDFEIVSDELDRQVNSSTALGFDLGAVYQTSYFRGGVTWLNVNEPEFDFPSVGVGCGQIADASQKRNCEAAQYFGDRISLQETWKLNDQARGELALHDPSQRLVLSASYDFNTVRDVSGDEYQWLAMSASYRLPWYLKWIPDMRVGYRENQAGSELSYYSLGLTWLGVLSLDAALSDQTIDHDGDSWPRSAMVNIGLQMRF